MSHERVSEECGGEKGTNITKKFKGAWVAQSVKCPTLAQVMTSWFVGSTPTLSSVLTAQSLEPASDSVPFSLCPPLLALCLSLFLKNQKHKKNFS